MGSGIGQERIDVYTKLFLEDDSGDWSSRKSSVAPNGILVCGRYIFSKYQVDMSGLGAAECLPSIAGDSFLGRHLGQPGACHAIFCLQARQARLNPHPLLCLFSRSTRARTISTMDLGVRGPGYSIFHPSQKNTPSQEPPSPVLACHLRALSFGFFLPTSVTSRSAGETSRCNRRIWMMFLPKRRRREEWNASGSSNLSKGVETMFHHVPQNASLRAVK